MQAIIFPSYNAIFDNMYSVLDTRFMAQLQINDTTSTGLTQRMGRGKYMYTYNGTLACVNCTT